MKKRHVKIYVKPGEWSAYVVSEDQFSKITVPVNRENMDPEIYMAGWEVYQKKWADDATVEVIDQCKKGLAA